MREVDIQVSHAVPPVGDRREGAVHAGAAGAQLRAELQQGGRLAEPVGAQALGLDGLVVDVMAGSPLPPLHENAERDGRREQHGEGHEGADEGHSKPA
ncbi:hypothetical protein GCM10009778_29810 [Microbacterium terricola]